LLTLHFFFADSAFFCQLGTFLPNLPTFFGADLALFCGLGTFLADLALFWPTQHFFFADLALSCQHKSSTFLQIFLGVLLIYLAVHPHIIGEKL
jgi:hypothetical protein